MLTISTNLYYDRGNVINGGYTYQTTGAKAMTGLGFVYPNFDDVLRGFNDAALAMQLYLQTVYGGTIVAAPTIPAYPNKRDSTKPVAIPVPPGAIAVPGSLTLTPEAVKKAVQDMVGATDIPGGNTGILDKVGEIATSLANFFDLSKPINWEPMRSIPKGVTTAFPFSLPWDVKRAIDVFIVPGAPPNFEVEMTVWGRKVKQKLPFADYAEVLAPLVRSGTVILFTVGLIFATRKFFGGAK